MKTILISTLASALSLVAFADPKDDVKAAAAKLADAPNYTWTAKTEMGGGNATPAAITGKAEKGGYAVVTSERDGNTTMAVLKGEKGVVKVEGAWKTGEELRAAAGGGGGGGGGGRGGGMRNALLLRTRLPGEDAGKMLERVKELKVSDGAIVGDLTEAGAKELLSFGRRPGGNAPEPKNAKGSVKYWLKDGQIAKMQVTVSGTVSFQNNERDTTRTTTYELKDIGSTKVEVPADAKSKLSS